MNQSSVSYERYIKHGNLHHHNYQEQGVSWCLTQENSEISGSILADEMGLGKTITMLGVVALNINSHKHTLVVVPPVLIEQWVSQCALILGHVPFVFYGSYKKHIDVIPSDAYVVITSYGSLSNKTLIDHKWDRIIFDEAHHMRNSKTRNFRTANDLTAKFKWLITGTPLQNKRKDLYSLFTLIKIPRATYIVEENRIHLLRTYMLRRTKASVGLDKNMPPLTIKPEMIKWNDPNEKQASEKIHEMLEFSRVKTKPTKNSSILTQLLADMPPIVLLTKAKQMCVMGTCNSKKQNLMSGTNVKPSKLTSVLDHIIKNHNPNSKMLIFCHFRNEMDAINDKLEEHNIKTAKIDGRIPSKKERARLLNDQSIEVLLLQLRVGCEGLNLQNYNEVYFVSPAWNPFIEDQAIARCHRLGQKKAVKVYRFYMQGFEQDHPTFSQDMYSAQVQDTKKKLEKEMLTVQ